MIQLVMIFCMIANGNVCAENRPVSDEPLSLLGCMTSAQQSAALYLDEHPQWRLSRIKCEIGVPREAHI